MIKKLLLASVVVGLLGVSHPAHAAGRISLSPTPINLTEGQSQVVTVHLDEPLIGPESDGYLDVTITVANPSRLTTTSTTLSWTQNNWFENRTFTLNAVDDLVVNGDVADIVDVSVDSNSEYYAGFQPTFTVNVLDNDVVAEALPTVLPEVGTGQSGSIMLLMAVGVSAAVFMLQRLIVNKRG